jgi:hypothetical protein
MNLFQDVLNDVSQVEQNLIGPSYPYYQNVLPPENVGMSTTGTISAMSNNINGLRQYINLLISGNSSASSTGKPLGNKYFMQTGAKCTDNSTNQQVDRYIYIDNVPNGALDFNVNLSSGMGNLASGYQGLIPGALGDLNVLNPFTLMQAFLAPNPAPCQEITMETIDNNNVTGTQTEFVTVLDIQNMDPCSFQNGQNPVTGQNCSQGFTQREKKNKKKCPPLPKDMVSQVYFTGLACVGIYIFYKIMEKSK